MSDAVPGGERSTGSDGDDDLAASLASLSRLSSARLSLEELLREVAVFAVQAIPGADGAGLTLFEADRSDTVVKSDPFVAAVDDIQYGLGEGPCITAAADRQVVRSGSLGGDGRWPRFGPRVGRLGVHSALSLPLIASDEVVGAMNVYAHAADASMSGPSGSAACSRRPRRSRCRTLRSWRRPAAWPRTWNGLSPTERSSTRPSAS